MITDTIKRHLAPSEEYIFGFADLHGLIGKKFEGFNYGISIGKRLDDKIIDKIKDGPTLEYYYYYNLINKNLAELTLSINSDLKSIRVDSIILEPTISEESKKKDQHLAGL